MSKFIAASLVALLTIIGLSLYAVQRKEQVESRQADLRSMLERCDEISASDFRKLIGALSDINARNSQGLTLLHCALNRSDPELLGVVISRGADTSIPDATGMRPLALAAVSGNESLLRLMLSNIGDVNERDSEGATALIWAARLSEFRATRVLIESGAALDVQDERGKTALMYAAYRATEEQEIIVRDLVESGANVGLSDKSGRTALRYAKLSGAKGVIRILQPLK